MRDITALRRELEVIAADNSRRNWTDGLARRKQEELDFHNRDRDRAAAESWTDKELAQRKGNKRYYSTVRQSQDYVDQWLARHVPGAVFLDYACGNGAKAISAAQDEAGISIGLDISDISVANARGAAEAAGVADRCVFVQGDCENTGLPDASVDVVLCSGMLHHLDLSYAFPELRRIVRPGGRILAVEALNYNPLIKAYRMATPEMRTEWEKRHILSLADVRFASRFFDIREVRYWHLMSPVAAFITNERLRASALGVLDAFDRALTSLPGVRLMAWQFTFEMIRRRDD